MTTSTPDAPTAGSEPTSAQPYHPVRVDAVLEEPLSRGLWLVKWLLVLPHVIVLGFLWAGFVVLSVVAGVAILFTGRYPRAIFDFTLGVLRWSWRVHYYAYAALGTDRYPPFTLADVPDYPARLDIAYPERLSRGLVLVKWLLALPHLVLVGIFAGGGLWIAWGTEDSELDWGAGGLVGLLVFVAGVVLLFTGRYPRPIYDFVLGMDRWVLRVAAYVGLMTDSYPPFRLDQGGAEPGQAPAVAAPQPAESAAAQAPAATASAGPGAGPVAGRPYGASASPWTVGRVLSVVAGAVLVLFAIGPITGGAALLWADRTQRDADGYLATSVLVDAPGYALTGGGIRVEGAQVDWPRLSSLLGDVRISATSTAQGREVFVGITSPVEAAGYLDGVARTTWGEVGDSGDTPIDLPGRAPEVPPTALDIWAAADWGVGRQSVSWPISAGERAIVVMNADGSRPVSVRAEVAATVPALPRIAIAMFAVGGVALAGGALLVAVGAAAASNARRAAA